MKRSCYGLLILLFVAATVSASSKTVTVIYEEAATQLTPAAMGANELWITTADLTRTTHFELKPQGVCRDQLCFPIPKARANEFTRRDHSNELFNLLAFAQLVRQPVAHDEALSMWYFGQRADQREALSSLQAPDFTLPDMAGKRHFLAELRGKKVLLVTWASW